MAILTVSDEHPSHITTLDPSKGYQPKATYVFDRCFNSATACVTEEAQRLLLGNGKDVGTAPTAFTALEEASAEGSINPILLECLKRDQAAVYGHVGRPVLLNALAGYNGCVFAYGQTGSGKTYTMMGPPGVFGATVSGAPGQVRAVTPAKKFRRAATAYNGQLRWTPEASADDVMDSRFQSFVSVTPRAHVRTPCSGGHRDTMSMVGEAPLPMDCSLSVSSDVLLQRSRRGSRCDSNVLYLGEEEGLQGIVPRLVRELFAELHQKREQDNSHSFRVEVEYYEIYREKVIDLLSSSAAAAAGVSGSGSVELRVRHSKSAGPYVENLTKKHVDDEGEVFRLLRHGNLRRHTASTAINDRSSRSHAIFVLHLVQMRISNDDSASAKVSSKVNLVDLAGSERTGAHSVEGDQFKEGVVINSSLTVLGRVIDALADKSSGKRNVFCPYRDSVLTWLLMDSLGGNSKTTMVATVSPHSSNFDEACQTLRYASRAKQIVTKVVVNEDPQVQQIKLLTAEVQRLKARLSAEGKAADNDDDVEVLQERIAALEEELNETRNQLEQKSSELAAICASRHTSSMLPSTLKAGNAGAAGTAKELAKAKSDVRRLEAENLLHLQTEQELRGTMERLKTLERKYGQLLSESKEVQGTAKKRDREMQEKDRRISELQHQLQQQAARMQADSSLASNLSALSPRSVWGKSGETESAATTTGVAPMTPIMNANESGKAAGKKTRKAKTGTAPPGSPQRRDSERLDEISRIRVQFEKDKKQLVSQIQERNNAFRKSQLEVKQLKSELKSEQDALRTVEKSLHDQHVETTRRLQEEVQELKRALKGECRNNKYLRQSLTAPEEAQPPFLYAYVAQTVYDEEKWRGDVQQQEASEWQHVMQVWQLSQVGAAKMAAVERQHASQIAALSEAHRTSENIVSAIRQELEEMRAVQDKANAMRERISELEDAATQQREREKHLREQVSDLEGQLYQEQERSKTALQRLEAELKDQRRAVATAEEAATSLKAAHAREKQQAESTMRAEQEQHATVVASLQAQIRQAEDRLHSSEEARRAQVRRGLEQASEHEAVLAMLRSQLESSKKAAATAEEVHRGERAALEQSLKQQEKAFASRVSVLEQELAAARMQLDRDSRTSAKALSELEEQLAAAQAAHNASAEALRLNSERAMAQAADHEKAAQLLRRDLDTERAAAQTAAHEHAALAATLAEELQTQRKQREEISASLTQQLAGLQSKLAVAEEARRTERTRAADAAAAQETALADLRAELESAQAAHTAAAKAHEEQLREMRGTHARLTQEVQSNADSLAAQVTKLQTRLAAVERDSENALGTLTKEMEAIRTQLHKSEEARRRQIQQSIERAGEHDAALAELRQQVAEEQAAKAAAAKKHEEELLKAEEKLSAHRLETSETISTLKQQLEQAHHSAQQREADATALQQILQRALDCTRAELEASEKARTAHSQQSLEKAAAHEQTEAKLRAEISCLAARADATDAAHSTRVAELEERLREQQCAAAAQLAEAAAALESERAKAQHASEDHKKFLAAVLDKVALLQAALAKSEEAERAQVQRLVEQSAAHDSAIQAARRDLQRQQAEAADLAAAHAEELHGWEARWQQQAALNKVEMESIRQEVEAQRRAEVDAAVKAHTAAVDALEANLSEAHIRLSEVEASRAAEAERREQQASEHAKAVSALEAELQGAHQASAAAAAAHEAAIQQLNDVIAEQQRAKIEEVATMKQKLLETQKKLTRSEEARRRGVTEKAEAATAHTQSLDALRRSMEAEHQQKLDALTAAKARELEAVQMQLDEQRVTAQHLQGDLRKTRRQVKQLVETQNCLGKQVEEEKQASAELRRNLADTAAQQAASAAAAAELETTLEQTKASLTQLVSEKTAVSRELAQAIETVDSTRAHLADVEKISQQRHEELEAQGAALANAVATVEQLRAEVSALHSKCSEMEKARTALIEQHEEALVAQQVDTVTEMETQFRAMECEREALVSKARQTEEALRSLVEKQGKQLQQLREDLEFRVSLDLCEAEVVERDSAAGAVGSSAGPALAGSGTGVATSNNTSFSGASGSAAAVGGGGFSTILSSLFSRRNSTAAPSRSPAPLGSGIGIDGTHSLPQQLPRPFSNDRGTATTPLRRTASGNLYSMSAYRPSSMMPSSLLFGKSNPAGAVAMGTSAGVSSASRTPVQDAVISPDTSEQESTLPTRLGSRAPNIALGRK
ncbi:putative kinesin [Leishmania major strain Friedlin]|uniref:Putative kinesin n=1 Tax=Leishmania major TaxID=5664 RepID=Q4QDF1_LEIMA|nr:putative kinesin [Leishmania major strain Friedlin]CAG9572757.1 kinesin_-_putative [Leishmania major strain Friedlin]CAJ07155.1 putative kinesin [Leishmania major strain Friedlin]|eukprot:XP_001682647.1 putative kinesin [Leishmania major strain Friedlin]